MKTRTILSALALCVVAASVSFAGSAPVEMQMGSKMDAKMSPAMGTWKLDEAKSKIGSEMTKNSTVMYEADGDSVKVTTEGTRPDGSSVHAVWTGKFDGKDYPVTGDPTSDMRSCRELSSHILAFTGKKDGKVVYTGRVVIAHDGKTRTVTVTGTDPKGMKHTSTSVYDKAEGAMGNMKM